MDVKSKAYLRNNFKKIIHVTIRKHELLNMVPYTPFEILVANKPAKHSQNSQTLLIRYLVEIHLNLPGILHVS